MSVIAEGVLSGPIVLEETLSEFPGAAVEAQYQGAPGSAFLLVEDCEFARFEAALAADETVEDVETIAAADGKRIYRVVVAVDRPMVVAEGTRFGIQVLSITAADGDWRLRLRAQDREALVEFRDLAATYGLSFRVAAVFGERGERSADVLTPAQKELLVAAYEHGYFAQPREVSLGELADHLDISSSAASGRLRRAVETLVARTVIESGEEVTPD